MLDMHHRRLDGHGCARLFVLGLAIGVGLVNGETAMAEIAVEVTAGAPDTIFPSSGTTHGWQFSVNTPIEVTHLGLYDRLQNGFAIDHPIGLWDERGTLLAEDMLSAGASNPLIDNFRYVDITDANGGGGVILSPGTTYTIGFFSATFNQSDGMVIFDGFHTINPVVDYAGFSVAGFTDGLEMPVVPCPFGLHRWGPNFQFEVLSLCPWDLNDDGVVNVLDLVELVMSFGPCEGCPADFDDDGFVGVLDLIALIMNFGPCPGAECVWDVNGDGVVDESDVQAVTSNLGPCEDPENCPWDVNGDGVVDASDVAAVATHFGPCPGEKEGQSSISSLN